MTRKGTTKDCFGGDKKLGRPVPAPEKTAELADIGTARTAEDVSLFGGVPDLISDRTASGSPAFKGQSGGLRPME